MYSISEDSVVSLCVKLSLCSMRECVYLRTVRSRGAGISREIERIDGTEGIV